jgi:hypothetical protein
MIIYWLVKILIYLLELVTSPLLLLPAATLSVDLTGTLTQAGQFLALFDIFLPIPTLFTVFGVVISVEAGYFGYKAVKWVYNKIPGIN